MALNGSSTNLSVKKYEWLMHIIAKVLANRLKRVVEKIISKSHNAFVKGRQILDFVLVAKECLDSRIRFCVPGVLCKQDLQIYDHVNCEFLLYLFRRCGFWEKLRIWIAHCIYTARIFFFGEWFPFQLLQ
jgi:hypothetical protein